MFNPTIDFGQIVTIVVALVGGSWLACRTLAELGCIKSGVARVEEILREHAEWIAKLKTAARL